MRQKRILFCVTNDLTFDQRMIRICTSLANQPQYQITLIGRKITTSIPLSNQNFTQKRLTCFFQKGKFFYLEFNIRLFFYLLFQKADAICAIDLDTILPVFWVTKLKKQKCIYDAHELFTEVPEVIRRPFIRRVWSWVANHTIPNIKNCYTVGTALAEYFKAQYAVHFEVIRNIAVAKKYTKPLNLSLPPNPIIIYQGAINEGRGLELAITMMAHLENYKLWIIGEGDITAKLKVQAAQTQYADRILFFGKKTPEELSVLTSKADLGIQFIENLGLSYYYSLANRTFDYIHAHLPALHPNFPEYKHIVEEFKIGELMRSEDAEKLALQVKFIVEDRVKYSLYQRACISASEKFCWENEEKKLIKFYSNVMDEGSF